VIRPIKPARRTLAGVSRLTAVGGASALLCLGAALVAPAASAAPASSVVNSAALVAGNPCDSANKCGRQPQSPRFEFCGANTQACGNGQKSGTRAIPPAKHQSSSKSTEA
jgi:hypothetical protein